jgi:two-component system, LytTR family, response regulator
MITAVIIDDEKNAQEVLAWQLTQYCPQIDLVGCAGNVRDGIKLINNKNPQLLFLDIEMPVENGFDLLEAFDDPSFDIIFTTAYNQYAIKAFKVSAFDYLLKPIDADDLKAAIERYVHKNPVSIKEQLKVLSTQLNRKNLNRIAIPSVDGLMMLKPEQIIRCESSSNYTTVFLTDKPKVVVAKTLKELEDVLTGFGFYRIHHSHLVNLTHVQAFVRNDGGYVTLTDGAHITVARNRRTGFMDQFSKI